MAGRGAVVRAVATLGLCLQLLPGPVTLAEESVLYDEDGTHLSRELTDLLLFIQEETSLSRESSLGEPASSGADVAEASRTTRGDSSTVIVGEVSIVPPSDELSERRKLVRVDGSRDAR